jgi:hypothetical protein
VSSLDQVTAVFRAASSLREAVEVLYGLAA